MQYYKAVVQSNNGPEKIYLSCSVYSHAETIYMVGKWAQAPSWLAKQGYHLLVFTNKEAAITFASYYPAKVFECSVEEEIATLPMAVLPSDVSEGAYEFTIALRNPHTSEITSWPKYTAMFKRVRLDKEINID